MRNLDELFKSAERLNAPDSLKQRVMETICVHEKAVKPSWLPRPAEWLGDLFTRPARAGFALAAVSVALAVAVGVHAPRPEAPATLVAAGEISEINEFMGETIGPVYSTRRDLNGSAAMVSDDVDEFVKTTVESVFWINGGSDNA